MLYVIGCRTAVRMSLLVTFSGRTRETSCFVIFSSCLLKSLSQAENYVELCIFNELQHESISCNRAEIKNITGQYSNRNNLKTAKGTGYQLITYKKSIDLSPCTVIFHLEAPQIS